MGIGSIDEDSPEKMDDESNCWSVSNGFMGS